jgi:hypothetical protein
MVALMMPTGGYDVFIAHRRNDAGTAISAHRHLNQNGISAFCDLVDDPSYLLKERIYEVIAKSHTFMLVASEAALESLRDPGSWLSRELACATTNRRRVVTLLLTENGSADLALERVSRAGPNHGPPGAISSGVFRPADRPDARLGGATFADVNLPAGDPLSRASLDSVIGLVHTRTMVPHRELSQHHYDRPEYDELVDGVVATVPAAHAAAYRDIARRLADSVAGNGPARSGRELLDAAERLGDPTHRSVVVRAVAIGTLRRLCGHTRAADRRSPAGRGGTAGHAGTTHHADPAGVPPADIRALWPLLRTTLGAGNGMPLHVTRSSQGFYSVPLYSVVTDGIVKELIRLHYWPAGDDDGADDGSDLLRVHSHQTHVRSWLLGGVLTNTVFDVTSADETTPESALRSLFEVRWDDHDGYDLRHQKSTAYNTGELVRVGLDNLVVFRAGQSYTVRSGVVHETRSGIDRPCPAATLCYFDSSHGWSAQAPVIGPTTLAHQAHYRHEWVEHSFLSAVDGVMAELP